MTMSQRLERALAGIRACLEELEPEVLTSEQAALLCDLGARLERAGFAVKVLAARRLDAAACWKLDGHRSAAGWLAEKSGTSLGAANSFMETAKKLQDLSGTEQAIKAGELSMQETAEIASVAEHDHAAERELLRVAKTHQLKKLQERARRIRAAAVSREEDAARHVHIHRRRYLRHRQDEEGAFRLDARLTVEAGARLLAGLEREAQAGFEEARKNGEHEAHEAYLADALVRLGTTSPWTARTRTGGSQRDSVVVHVDATALRRGHKHSHETCEIAGVGPVSVSTARRMIGDAFLKILVEDSTDVLSVCHFGRTVKVHVQSALEARDRVCVVPGCQVAHGLEIHHWKKPFYECGTSNLDGLARVCSFHHDQISYKGFELGGGPGRWNLAPPGARRRPDGEDPTPEDPGKRRSVRVEHAARSEKQPMF